MKLRIPHSISLGIFSFLVITSCLALQATLTAQQPQPIEVYRATVIASEGVAGSSGRIVIRISAMTTEAERKQLLDAFKQDRKAGTELLRTMNKGLVTIEGQSSRQIYAVIERKSQDGSEVVILTEHLASKLERWKDIKTDTLSVAVCHLRLSPSGDPESGEIFPAVTVSATKGGYIDVQTEGTNKVAMIEITRH